MIAGTASYCWDKKSYRKDCTLFTLCKPYRKDETWSAGVNPRHNSAWLALSPDVVLIAVPDRLPSPLVHDMTLDKSHIQWVKYSNMATTWQKGVVVCSCYVLGTFVSHLCNYFCSLIQHNVSSLQWLWKEVCIRKWGCSKHPSCLLSLYKP